MTEDMTIAGNEGRFDDYLRDIGIAAVVLPMPPDEAKYQTRLFVNNPRPLMRADALSNYEKAR
jgi:hypothetical protein